MLLLIDSDASCSDTIEPVKYAILARLTKSEKLKNIVENRDFYDLYAYEENTSGAHVRSVPIN